MTVTATVYGRRQPAASNIAAPMEALCGCFAAGCLRPSNQIPNLIDDVCAWLVVDRVQSRHHFSEFDQITAVTRFSSVRPMNNVRRLLVLRIRSAGSIQHQTELHIIVFIHLLLKLAGQTWP